LFIIIESSEVVLNDQGMHAPFGPSRLRTLNGITVVRCDAPGAFVIPSLEMTVRTRKPDRE
jgi:hypothetical protein